MAQGDYLVQNQGFPAFRSDLNSTLEAINTSNSGTSRPTSAVAGTIWLDTTSATSPTLKFYDGTDDISLATIDYSANTVNWLDSTVVSDLVNDSTPQLGGNLDVNGNSIVSVSNGNITFTPDGTGKVIIDGLSFPTSDGTADQVLKTDGSGNLSFTDVSGGISWQSSIVTGSTLSAVAGNGYWIDTTSNACTVTLPASASVGDEIVFVDYARTWGTNAITIDQNGLNYQGDPDTLIVEYNTNGQSITIVYSGATKGWIPTVDDDVRDAPTAPPITVDFLVVAGGAAGTNAVGGGGGAGGYRSSFNSESSGGGGSAESALGLIEGETYTITVGSGGASSPTADNGASGGISSISGTGITTITSNGGGGGGRYTGTTGLNGASGGSGGGGGANNSGTSYGGTGTANQGYDGGGAGTHPDGKAGGGGGAGAIGGTATNTAGAGGTGVASTITGSSVTRGGGGGGSGRNSGPGGTGGAGGGGSGNNSAVGSANAGTANTGGGGGGAHDVQAASGGSGVVILRMADADYSTTTTGSPTVNTNVGGSGETVLIFNGSGSYTA